MAARPSWSRAADAVGKWLYIGPVAGVLVLGSCAPVLALIDTSVREPPPGLSYDVGFAVIAAAAAGMMGFFAGLVCGAVCGLITAIGELLEWGTRRFYSGVAVAATAGLGSVFCYLTQWPGNGLPLRLVWFDVVTWEIAPVFLSSFAAYGAAAWAWRSVHQHPLELNTTGRPQLKSPPETGHDL